MQVLVCMSLDFVLEIYKQGVALAHDIIYGGQALEKMSILAEFSKTQTIRRLIDRIFHGRYRKYDFRQNCRSQSRKSLLHASNNVAIKMLKNGHLRQLLYVVLQSLYWSKQAGCDC